jgi:murein DD-endopeptidase MepM/ murein hydrolase activator NlpD
MTNVSFVTIPDAIITQKFNNYNPSNYGGDGKHKGIDFGIMVGNPVYACMDGLVKSAIVTQTGYGRHIRLMHEDGSMSIYGHLSKLLVAEGDKVLAGQEIGKSGGDPNDAIDGDGFSTGAHLHWEIRPSTSLLTDQGAVDPMEWCIKYIPGIRKQAEVIPYEGLRARAMPIDGRTLYIIPHRTQVNIIEETNGWSRLLSLRPEWCSSAFLLKTGIETNPNIPPIIVYTDAEKLERLWNAHPELH